MNSRGTQACPGGGICARVGALVNKEGGVGNMMVGITSIGNSLANSK